MPIAKLIRSSQFPYHITSRSNNKEWFYIPTQDVWKYSLELLSQGHNKFEVKLDAFVLMSNHYHMCVYTPQANIDEFMQFFNKNLGTKISRQAGRINRIFGAQYKWNIIRDDNYYQHVIRYIYQNPLRAGLVTKCEDYPYSDIMKQGFGRQEIEWMNSFLPIKESNSITKKLRRFEVK